MIDKGDANSIKSDYLESLQLIINRIIQKKDQSKEKINNNITIVVGQKTVFQGENIQNPTINTIKAEDVKKIEKAIDNPESLKGSIIIKVDDKQIFNVDKGQLVKDELKLSNVPVVKATVKERTYTVKELQKQVEVLKSRLDEQEKTITQLSNQPQNKETLERLTKEIETMAESLTKQQKLIDATQKSLNEMNLVKPQNTRLQNWVGSIENKVKEVSNSLFESAKNKMREVGKKIDDSIYRAKSKMIEVAITTLLDKLGTRNRHDGSLSFTSNKYQFHQDGNKVTLSTKEGVNVFKNGEISKEISPALQEEIKQLPEKVFELMDKLDQEEREILMEEPRRSLAR